MKNFYLPITAFVVGASVMAIEMTASRILAPHFGASFFVWTALIVTVLLSMSLGYWVGGRFTHRLSDSFEPLGFLLCGAAGLLLVGLWGSYSLSSGITLFLLAIDGASGMLFLGALLMTFLLFSLPVFILAASGPVILKLWSRDNTDVGAAAGRYFALSTVGSVIGTVLPSLVLVPVFGVKLTFMMVALVLTALGLPVLQQKLRLAAGFVLALALAMLYLQSDTLDSDIIYMEDSPYQLIRVEQTDKARYLTFNAGSGIQSVLFPARQRTHMYYDHLAAVPLLADVGGDQLRTAVLGLAGGTLVRQFLATYPEHIEPDITGVEVDPQVVEVAENFFDLGELPIQVAVEDGRNFLTSQNDPFDVLILDAYSTQMYIPPHMVSREFFSLARSRLTPTGLVVMNINATSPDSELLLAISNTVASVFPHVYITKAGRTWNYLVVASNRVVDYQQAAQNMPEEYLDIAEPLRKAREITYDDSLPTLTDDWAPIEFMTDRMIVADALRQMLGG